jgi:probable F420-dependent oxidoreductase
MELGVTMFATDVSMPIVDLARAVEERGLASLYVPEHTHIPVSRRTPPPTGDAELPVEYRRTLDPFVALSMAAAVTTTIKVGTGICLVAQRDPIVTAKEVATLDRLSSGRFVFGIGFGWNQDEIEHHGVDFKRRRDVTREHVLAMRALWTQETGEFHGEFVDLSPSWAWPKPVQQPSPPVLLGGAPGPKLFAAIADYGDGWIPVGGAGMRDSLDALRRAYDERDRDFDQLRLVPFGTMPTEGKLDYYASFGVTEVVLRIPSAPADKVLPVLDEFATLLR